MHIKLNAQSAAMFMEQMDRTCMRGGVPSVKRERLVSGTGKLLGSEIIRYRQFRCEMKHSDIRYGKA